MTMIKEPDGTIYQLDFCPNCTHGWMDCPADCSDEKHNRAIDEGRIGPDDVFCPRCQDERQLPCDFYCDDGIIRTQLTLDDLQVDAHVQSMRAEAAKRKAAFEKRDRLAEFIDQETLIVCRIIGHYEFGHEKDCERIFVLLHQRLRELIWRRRLLDSIQLKPRIANWNWLDLNSSFHVGRRTTK